MTTWREQIRRELDTVARWQWIALSVWWLGTLAFAAWVYWGVVGDENPVVGLASAAAMAMVIPGMLAIALALKVTYAMTRQRFPKTIEIMEFASGAAFMIVVLASLVFGAWQERDQILTRIAGAAETLFGILVGGAVLLSAPIGFAADMVFSVRGLLVVIAILLFQIVRRLDRLRTRP